MGEETGEPILDHRINGEGKRSLAPADREMESKSTRKMEMSSVHLKAINVM